jgi:hypothetical protein
LTVALAKRKADQEPRVTKTFDATLKDMGRDSPHGFLATFDRRPGRSG